MIGVFLVVSTGIIALLFIATRPVRDARNYPGSAILDPETEEDIQNRDENSDFTVSTAAMSDRSVNSNFRLISRRQIRRP
jgi:hypothetical protein